MGEFILCSWRSVHATDQVQTYTWTTGAYYTASRVGWTAIFEGPSEPLNTGTRTPDDKSVAVEVNALQLGELGRAQRTTEHSNESVDSILSV